MTSLQASDDELEHLQHEIEDIWGILGSSSSFVLVLLQSMEVGA